MTDEEDEDGYKAGEPTWCKTCQTFFAESVQTHGMMEHEDETWEVDYDRSLDDCHHPHSKLENFSIPSTGDPKQGSNISVQATCSQCEQTVICDTRITDVMETA